MKLNTMDSQYPTTVRETAEPVWQDCSYGNPRWEIQRLVLRNRVDYRHRPRVEYGLPEYAWQEGMPPA